MIIKHREYDIGNEKKIFAYYNENMTTEVSQEAFERIIIPAVKKQEKYRWHNVVKNPDDMPQDNNILLLVETSNKLEFYMALYNKDIDLCWSIDDTCYTVKAWKYIEPYEVEE